MRLYTWQDMCDLEFLITKKIEISKEANRIAQGGYYGTECHSSFLDGEEKIVLKLDFAFVKAIDDLIKTLGK